MPTLEYTSCLFCGQEEATPWGAESGFQAVKCTHCGLVYVTPRPSLEAIATAVQLGAHQVEEGRLDVVGRFHPARVRKFRRRLLELFRHGELTSRPVRWLDVGAGFGELLLALRGLLLPKSAVHGVEPCVPKTTRAIALGLDVREHLADAESEYDYLSLVNVFSHLREPTDFLAMLRSKLRPRGELLLVTGNGGDVPAESYPDALYLPDHLVFAGEHHVLEMCRRAGYDVLDVQRYRQFLPESLSMAVARHLYNQVRGRPSRLAFGARYRGAFRSLWIRAQARI